MTRRDQLPNVQMMLRTAREDQIRRLLNDIRFPSSEAARQHPEAGHDKA